MMSVNNAFRRIFPRNYDQYKIRSLCSLVANSKDNRQTNTDILMNTFKYANSTSEVLDTVGQHKDVMNSRHVIQALRALFVLQKEGRSNLSTKSIINDKSFEQLCGKLKTLSGTISTPETIEALKVVTYVGVPKNSTIVQILLQLLRQSVNDLNLQQIIFLDFLLGQYKEVRLAEALKMAMPIVFEIQLPIKMDSENINSLREYLQYASKHHLSNKSVELILSKMMSCKDKYDAKVAKSVIWSLCDLQPRESFEPLMKQNFDILAKELDSMSFNDLDITLKKIAGAYIHFKFPFYRNKKFVDAFVNFLIERDLGFKDAIYVTKKLVPLCVTNKDLIDYISSQIAGAENVDFYFYYVLLRYLAKTDYRPKNWDTILARIEKMEIKEIENVVTLKLAAVLAQHQIFKENMIENVFNCDFDSGFHKKRIMAYMNLYHSVKLYKPELTPKNFKPEDFIDFLTAPKEFSLEGALFNAYGGENYVKTGLYSKEGIFIDHVIVFRKGGYPVSTNFTSKFIEDEVISSDQEMVLVLCLHPDAYTEEGYLRKTMSCRIKLLEKLGYTVVPVCWESWKSLLDYEKIPYLVQNVKNKLRQDLSVSNYG